MIELSPLWQFMILLATHYVADFLLQTHWQAENKSRNNLALAEHVAVYTLTLAAVSLILFGLTALWFAFVWINGMLHFCTDYMTSRWSAVHFRAAIRDMRLVANHIKVYGCEPDALHRDANPGKHWHNFFGVIGFDQLLHQLALATTLWLTVA